MPDLPTPEQPIVRQETTKPNIRPEVPRVDATAKATGESIGNEVNQGANPDDVIKRLAEGGDSSETTPIPGSLTNVTLRLEDTLKKQNASLLKNTRNNPGYRNSPEHMHAIKQAQLTEKEIEVADMIAGMKAIDLMDEKTQELIASGGDILSTEMEDFLPEAKKMQASEATDILQGLIYEWHGILDNDELSPGDAAELKFRIAAARNLEDRLIREENEVPRSTEQQSDANVSSRTSETKSAEEQQEQIANELAKATHDNGFGQLWGFLYPVDKTNGLGQYPGQGFSMGSNIVGNEADYRALQKFLPRYQFDYDYSSPNHNVWSPYDHVNRQMWVASNFQATSYTGSGEEAKTFQGKHGEKDWSSYDYYMYTETPYDTRGGVQVRLSVAVPPDIARKLDTAVSQDPLFPDRYFKALFPGMVGENGETNIRRKRATELATLDYRNYRSTFVQPTPQIRQFPKAIEY